MKIYTKGGDQGTTALLGGTRVPKYHIRIEAYGTVDELNSCLGQLRDTISSDHQKSKLLEIQNRLFVIGANLATDPKKSKVKRPDITVDDIGMLEDEIDSMQEILPELKHFILPGGHVAVSHSHIARCVCRRAERITTALKANEYVDDRIIMYLNRLSDYLFVLARKIGLDEGVEEIIWESRQ